jgi:hypothetical protein
LCDILYKLTQEKRVVTRWRVKTLFQIRVNVGKIQTLENLIRKCKDLRPDLIQQVSQNLIFETIFIKFFRFTESLKWAKIRDELKKCK